MGIDHRSAHLPGTAFSRALMNTLIETRIRQSIAVKEALARESLDTIAHASSLCIECLKRGRKLIFFGNGGSAADAEHIAAEMVGRFLAERAPLPAIALAANTPLLTALGNDYGFDQVFSRQICALGNPGDLAFALSTSGNSPNVLNAIAVARAGKLRTIGLTGKNGGRLALAVDLCLCVPSTETPRIQEAHILIGHIVSEIVEQAFLDRQTQLATASQS
jgi:D-sedoheptulose 7-phosphate isomerase